MRTPRRIFLNPCDYLFYSTYRTLLHRSDAANVAFMNMELAGRIDPDCIRSILRRLLAIHPVLMSPLRISLVAGKPFWKIPKDIPKAASAAVERIHTYEDLRGHQDAETRVEELFQQRYAGDWDIEFGPPIHLEQYDLPGDRTRFVLRWPHLLMDAGGAQWFFVEMGRLGDAPLHPEAEEPYELPPGLRPDHAACDPLRHRSLPNRLGLFLRSFTAQRRHARFNVEPLFSGKPPAFADLRCLHRRWSGEQLRRLKSVANRTITSGPFPQARYLAVCVLRALHRIFTEQGVKSDAYLITMPISIFDKGQPEAKPATRPVPGNYLVSPILWGRREIIDDKRALGDELLRQIIDYDEKEVHLKQWAMAWMAGKSRAGMYEWLMRLPFGYDLLSSGFSYYGEISCPLRQLCGATVTNLFGGGPSPMPPGWNPVFSKFGDNLNLSMTYVRPGISDDLARRYFDLIEAESFESG